MSHIAELMQGIEHVGVRNMVFNTMLHEANQCPYQIVFDGPWGFEPHIGAHCMEEAHGTAKAFAREYPDTTGYEIWCGSDICPELVFASSRDSDGTTAQPPAQ